MFVSCGQVSQLSFAEQIDGVAVLETVGVDIKARLSKMYCFRFDRPAYDQAGKKRERA